MRNGRYPSTVLLVLALVAIIGFLHLFRLPENSRFWKAIGDTGHVPIFGLMAIILLVLSYKLIGYRIDRPVLHYLLAFLISILVGTVSEIIQIFGPREADIGDLGRDIAGAAAFLGIYYLIDSRVEKQRSRLGNRGRRLIWVGSVVVLIGALYQLGFVTTAYLKRDEAFPLICSFDAAWEKAFWIKHDTDIKVVNPPEKWRRTDNNHVGELTFDTVTYPGFHIQEPYPDWRDYNFLLFDIYSDLDTTVGIYFRLHDIHHNKDYNDRYNNHFFIKPGLNQILIPLADIRNAPKERKMDMSLIRTFGIFAYRPPQPFTIYLDNFRLK
jgi:hypothetical protein